jgi:cytidylate kinase
MDIEDVDRREAAKRMKEADAARTAYVRQFYHCDARSPEHYHLVLDTPALGIETCVELIVAAASARETATPARRGPRAAPEAST